MRSAIIGVCYGNDISKLRSLVKASTRITHKDAKAEWGALAVAIAVYLASTQTYVSPKKYYETVTEVLGVEAAEFCELIRMACDSVQEEETAAIFATQLKINSGISGYVYHTVRIVIQVWLRHQENYANAIEEIVRLGGDTDTTSAILGGIIAPSIAQNQPNLPTRLTTGAISTQLSLPDWQRISFIIYHKKFNQTCFGQGSG